jgi:hypothetical protein
MPSKSQKVRGRIFSLRQNISTGLTGKFCQELATLTTSRFPYSFVSTCYRVSTNVQGFIFTLKRQFFPEKN